MGQQRPHRIGRPTSAQLQQRTTGSIEVLGRGDGRADRFDPAVEMRLGRRNRRLRQPLDRPARFSEADMAVRQRFFLSRAAEKAAG
jgi:hypothetical protein